MAGFMDSLKASLAGVMRNTFDAQMSVSKGVYDIAKAAFGPDDVSKAWDDFSKVYQDKAFAGLGDAGNIVNTLIESNRVTSNAAKWAEASYHETVGRGVSTLNLAHNEADTDNEAFFGAPVLPYVGKLNTAEEWKTMFDGDTWVKAYNMSDKISPGQSFAGMVTNMSPDEIEKKRTTGEFEEGKLKWLSGAGDVVTRFADPTNLVGKAVSVGRLKYIKPISTTADAKKYTESGRFNRMIDGIQKAKSKDEIRLRYLNNNADGGLVAEVLWNTRHDPEMLRIGTRAAYGDTDALGDLMRYNDTLAQAGDPRLAEGIEAMSMLGRKEAGQIRSTTLQRVGTALEEPGDWDTYVSTLKADEQLFDQLTVLRPELLAELSSRKPLASTNAAIPTPAMRDSLSSRLRFSVHQSSYYGAPVIVSSGFKKMLGSNRRIHGIDFDDGNSDQAVRTYLERSGMPEAQKTQLLDQYIGASANKSMKQAVMVRAEEAVIRHMGKVYGYTEDDVNGIISKAAANRSRARTMLANKHEFASEDLQKQFVDEGVTTTWTDEAGGIHATSQPVTEPQLMDIFPVADPGQLHSVMKSAASQKYGSGARAVGAAVAGDVSDVLDSVHRLWKPMVLIGLGYPVRALSDEGGRQIALYGMRDVTMSTGKGFTNSVKNHAEMGAAKFDRLWNDRNRIRIRQLQEETLDPQKPATNRWLDVAQAFTTGNIARKDFAEITHAASEAGLGDMFEAARFADADLGILNKQEFERTIVHKALQRDGKSWFIQPSNQKNLIQQVDADGIVDINPLTGEKWAQGKAAEVGKPLIIKPDEVAGHATSNSAIYDFVYDNSDSFLKDGAGMRVLKREDGSLELRAYAPKRTVAERRLDVKRMKREFVKSARNAGNKPVRYDVAPGVTWEFEAAAAGAGEAMTKKVSSDDVHMNYMMQQHGLASDRIHASAGWSAAVNADHVDYPKSWERAALLQLGNDPAARRFMDIDGDYQNVKRWAEESEEGKRWAREGAAFGDLDTRLQRVEMMADSYVPDVGDLRKKVLDGTVLYDDLVRNVPDASARPQVHGEVLDYNIGGKKSIEYIRKGMNKTMEKIATIPSDRLSRMPFFAKSYRNHVQGLAKLEFEEMAKKWEAGAEGASGHMISVDRKFAIQQAARQRALADVKKWLYNSDMTSDAVSSMRHFAPFAAAWQDGMRAWGRIAVQKPQAMAAIYQVWHAPERAGLIIDADGRELSMEDGKEVWYEEAPNGDRVKAKGPADESRFVSFQIPTWMTPDQFGKDVKVPVKINKNSFNTFMHLDPGAGPIVAIAASEFVQTDKGIPFSDNALMKRVLPFGPSDSMLKPALSNEARGILEVWRGEDDTVYRNQTMMILQAEIVKYNMGERVTKPTFDEAKDKASDLKLMRTVLTSVLPVSPQFMSPYQAHIDAYHQLSAKDPMSADDKFYELYGDDFFILTARVTKGVKGLPPTMEGYKQLKKYRDLVGKYPEIAGAIIGSTTGSFNKSVYEYQKANRIRGGSSDMYREMMSLEESMEENSTRLGWIKFQSLSDTLDAEMIDRGITDINHEDAEDLKAKRDALIDQIGFNEDGTPTAWYEAYSSTGSPAKMIQKLAGLKAVASDPRMIGREDISGVADYLLMRKDFKDQLRERADAGGAKTLEAKDNEDLFEMWNEAVMSLKDQNLAFASLYNRYLIKDTLEV